MDFWNTKDLPPPPITSCKLTLKEIDIRLLHIALNDGMSFFQNQPYLRTEAALLSRSIYRLKMKFRSSKDFKALERLSRVLRTYLQVDVSKALTFLTNCVPQSHEMNESCVLTKNALDFVLVRLQGLGKLLFTILESCKVASNLLQQRLRLGHFWKIAVVVYAVVARIFVVTKNILKATCELYTNLLPFSSSLCNSGVQWLPERYVLPDRLEEWLDINWLDLNPTVIEISDDEPEFSYFNLIDDDSDDDIEFCDEYIVVNDESSLCESRDVDESAESHSKEVAGFRDSEDDVICLDNVANGDDSMTVTNAVSSKTSKQDEDEAQCISKDEVDVGEVIDLSTISETPHSNESRPKRTKRSGGRKNSKSSIGELLHSPTKKIPMDVQKRNKNRNKRKRKSKNTSTQM